MINIFSSATISDSFFFIIYCISGVIVSMLVSIVVDHGFEPQSGQTKNNEIGICFFSAKHAILMSKSKV